MTSSVAVVTRADGTALVNLGGMLQTMVPVTVEYGGKWFRLERMVHGSLFEAVVSEAPITVRRTTQEGGS